MKRFWLILLSLGLVMAFSVSAFAVDVKFSGDFYAAGVYVNKTKVREAFLTSNPSTAFYFQRLRLESDFIVSPGLKLITRFDAMERAWGAPRSYPDSGILMGDSAGTEAENENIAFDWAYIQYASPVGIFNVGYQNDGTWGTVFGDSSIPQGKIGWSIQQGGWTVLAEIVKMYEGSKTAKLSTNLVDNDVDRYQAGVIYSWKGGQAGFAAAYYRYAYEKYSDWYFDYPTLVTGFLLMPYAIVQIGPVKVQAELNYAVGDAKMEDGVTGQDVKLESIGFYLDAVADFKMFYAGGTFAYVSGDDPATSDKWEGGLPFAFGGLNGGIDWNPCLIMFNYDVISKWVGQLQGWSGSRVGGPMTNAWFGQLRAGVRPVSKLDIMASLSYAQADKKPDPWGWGTTYLNNKYGWEVDVTGTYKITNNLSYMLGVGYLFTGDYYKGYDWGTRMNVLDDYLVINKLTLTF